ncbi:MAG: TolC family protein [Balneolaceae bacterium]
MKKSLLVTVLVTVLYTSTTFAQQIKKTITLQEAIELAVENNYQLKIAENNLGLAEYRITSNLADFLPSINSSLNYSQQQGQQFIQETLRFTDLTSTGFSGRVSANMPIFNGFNNILNLRASKASKLSSEESLNRIKENVIFDAASRYLQVLLNTQLLEDAVDNLETSQKVLEQTAAQVEVGSRPNVDLYNQEATVANNEFTVIQRENALKLAKLQLVRSLQIDPLEEYEFVVPDFDAENAQKPVLAGYDIRDLIEEALTTRSDLKSTEFNIHALRYSLQMAKYSLFPSISANVGLSSSYSDQARDPLTGGNASFNDQFFDQRINKSIGLSLNFPIFSNWNRMTQIQSAAVNLKNAELGLENTSLQVIQEVTQAYNDFSAYSSQLTAANKSLIAAEKAFETQQERYNVGASTLIELSQAQTQYFAAQSSRTSALYNLIFQDKLLDYYLGKLNLNDVSFN